MSKINGNNPRPPSPPCAGSCGSVGDDAGNTVDATVAEGDGRVRLLGKINANNPLPRSPAFAGARRDTGEDTGNTVDATVARVMVGLASSVRSTVTIVPPTQPRAPVFVVMPVRTPAPPLMPPWPRVMVGLGSLVGSTVNPPPFLLAVRRCPSLCP